MYFKLSESEKLKWDGIDENWFKPSSIEHFMEEKGGLTTGAKWFYIGLIVVIILACLFVGYLIKKNRIN